MKLKFDGQSKVYFYTDESANSYPDYRRDDSNHGNWQVLMGDSWEPCDRDEAKELEAFHSESMTNLDEGIDLDNDPTEEDNDPTEEVEASLKRALQQIKAGERVPLPEIWAELDDNRDESLTNP